MNCCTEKPFARGMCRNHYASWHRKQNPESYKKAAQKYQQSDKYKSYIKEYKKKHGIKSLPFMHKKRFGGLREQVIQRDGEECYECSMSREEHKKQWGRDITVDHVDGQGRYSKTQNNDMDNLITLCLRCHGKKDKMRGLMSR